MSVGDWKTAPTWLHLYAAGFGKAVASGGTAGVGEGVSVGGAAGVLVAGDVPEPSAGCVGGTVE
jgi:hypothetical protein